MHWIKGHAMVGGNERVDKVSKRYANVAGNTNVTVLNGRFDCSATFALWALGLPTH